MSKISVKTTGESIRRGGFRFQQEPTVIDVKDLSKDQLAAIQAEPRLVVTDVDDKEGRAAEKAAAAAAAAAKAAEEAAAKADAEQPAAAKAAGK